MIFIPLIHGSRAVQHHLQKFRPVTGHGIIRRSHTSDNRIPGAMRFQIGLIDHVEPQRIAQTVQSRLVGVVARTHGIDIIALHRDKIAADHICCDAPTGLRAEFMPVDTVKHNPLSVQQHKAVTDLESAETDLFPHCLPVDAIASREIQPEIIQRRLLRTPQLRRIYGEIAAEFFTEITRLINNAFPVAVIQPDSHRSLSVHRRSDLQHSLRKPFIQIRQDPDIFHVHVRLHHQFHIPENTREPEEVLIFAPAAGCPPEYLNGQAVRPVFLQIRRHIKRRRREGILTVSHVSPVHPDGDAALCALKNEMHGMTAETFRYVEHPDIRAHRIKSLRNLSRL